MSFRIQNPAQPAMDALSNSPASTTKTGSSQNATSAYSSIGALADTQDTASISSAPGQLSGDLPIRQDRVDALRTQLEYRHLHGQLPRRRHRHVPEPLPELSMNRPAPDVSQDVPPGVPPPFPPAAASRPCSQPSRRPSSLWWRGISRPFSLAVERQREVCAHLARHAEWRQAPNAAATAQKVRELNRVYHRLLRHSLQWTRTLQSIFEAAGHPPPSRATVHFRG